MLDIRQDRRPETARIARQPVWTRHVTRTDAGLVDVLDIGKRAGHAVLLVTHGLGSIESVEEIAEGLEARFPGRRIIAYSRPGRGASPEAADVACDRRLSHEALHLLPALMRVLEITSVDLVAHSDGVAVALLFASACPWMVARIVAISPQVHGDPHYVTTTAELLADQGCRDEIDRLGAEHANVEGAIRCWSAERQALAVNPHHVLARISPMTAPLLLVQGLRDEYGTAQQMEAISARIKGPMQWVILRKDGHHPQRENPDVVLDLIARHIEAPFVPHPRHTAVAREV